jgi:glycerol-3-phosphate dehydrogenase (NAD(P)+)
VKRLAVIGGGAWGSALASVAARAGAGVVLWARDPAVVAALNQGHENPVYLPGIALDPRVAATTDAAAAIAGTQAALIVVPAQFLRGALDMLAPLLPAGLPLLLCAKGIETGSLQTMSEIAREIVPDAPVAILSGPSFAAEVARGLPAAVTIAARDPALAGAFVTALGTARFRPYSSEDPIGAEIGGAVKNVLAIACGIIEGRGLGDNARAALITRGLAEMVRLGLAKGAAAETFRGLSGLGDLVLTCTGDLSRNRRVGLALADGKSLAEILAELGHVAEGVPSAAAVHILSNHHSVEMPICDAVHAVLYEGLSARSAVERLLAREPRSEQH